MDLQDRGDIISGVCVAAFGLYVTIQSARLTYVSDDGPGPGFLPLWLGIGLIALALSLLMIKLARPSPKQADKSSAWLVIRALGGWLATMIAIYLLPRLGFSVSLALLTVFLVLILDGRSLWTALSVAVGLALGFHLIFVVALGLALPSNPWGF